MASGVDELLDMLYKMLDEAKNVPFSTEKCILDRDRAMDLIAEIQERFPAELKEARKIITARNEYVASAKREGDLIIQQAKDKAKKILDEDAIMSQVKQKGAEMLRQAEERSRELRRAANEYCEDALRRTEEAVAEAYDEIKKSRSRFRAAATGLPPSPSQGKVFDAEVE